MKFLRCKLESIPPITGRSVGIIGSGPAGLGAAGLLACKGLDVHVYEMHPEPGGLLIFGIPDFRIRKDLVRRGTEELADTGRVYFHINTTVGRDVSLEDLIGRHDALLIASGTVRTRKLKIPGADADGVYGSVEWIIDYYRVKMGYEPYFHEAMPKILEPVGIIGAGLTAADVAHVTRVELGRDTMVIYRRSRKEAPMGLREIQGLESKGVRFIELLQPKEIVPGPDGRVSEIICYRTTLGEPDETGRRRFIIIEDQTVSVRVRTVFQAIGPLPTPPFQDGCCGIKIREDNTIWTDEKFRTTRRGVFAAGDVRHGPSLIGPALKSGMDAAKHILEYLETGEWL